MSILVWIRRSSTASSEKAALESPTQEQSAELYIHIRIWAGLQNIGIWSAGPATDTLMNESLGLGLDMVMAMSSPLPDALFPCGERQGVEEEQRHECESPEGETETGARGEDCIGLCTSVITGHPEPSAPIKNANAWKLPQGQRGETGRRKQC